MKRAIPVFILLMEAATMSASGGTWGVRQTLTITERNDSMIATRELPELSGKDKARFWSRVDKSGGDEACWIWKTKRSDDKYGVFRVGDAYFLAHRLSFVLSGGTFGNGPLVLHGPCNRRNCVNPSHLRSGDDAQNMADKKRDNTENNGERHGLSKLKDSDVIEIRERHSTGTATRLRLARDYGVTKQTISKIIRRQQWKHLP
jgi:hypothetical protein